MHKSKGLHSSPPPATLQMQDSRWDHHLAHIASAKRFKQCKGSCLCPLPLQPGIIMAEKYVRMATMKSLTGASQGAGIPDLINIVARCASWKEIGAAVTQRPTSTSACMRTCIVGSCWHDHDLPVLRCPCPLNHQVCTSTCRSAELANIKLRRSEKKASGVVGPSHALRMQHSPAGVFSVAPPPPTHHSRTAAERGESF